MRQDYVISSDENYSPHLATLICSICENNQTQEKHIHIFDFGIAEDSFNSIKKLESRYSTLFLIRYHIADEDIRHRLCEEIVCGSPNLATFSRLLIPELLPIDVDRCLYIDTDAVVLDDLDELFAIDMQHFYIAGVRDFIDVSTREAVEVFENDMYINAGVILWNLKLCREKKVVDIFAKFISSRNGIVPWFDQGTVNGSLRGNIMELPPQYDMYSQMFCINAKYLKRIAKLKSYYSQDQISYALINPVIVHYCGALNDRPWNKGCRHPYRKAYEHYRALTDFYPYKLSQTKRKGTARVFSFVLMLFPYNFRGIILDTTYKILIRLNIKKII